MEVQLTTTEQAVEYFKVLEKKILRRFFIWGISILATAGLALVPFYYHTSSDVEYLKETTRENTQSIKELTEAVHNISQPAIISTVEIKNLDEKIKGVKDDQIRMENKVDKLDEKIERLTEIMLKRK